MASKRTRSHTSARSHTTLHKPKGYFHDRVERAGPTHFGIACFDCHKDYSQWLLADFFGNLLRPPQRLPHNRSALDDAVCQLQQAQSDHALTDLLVVIERTGRYHRVVQRAFIAASFEVRIVHPFATKQFRQVANPGDKTDDHDLFALHRAATNGFALAEPQRDELWTEFLRLVRYRRGLIHKTSRLRCQIRNHLDAYLPGFVDCFDNFWHINCTWPMARHFLSPQAIHQLGADGLYQFLRDHQVRFHRRSLPPILEWAKQAPLPDIAPANAQRIAVALEDDRLQKAKEIATVAVEVAGLLCRTPYVLLLSCPGLGVATVADMAAELGPISHYADARGITGRAGLRPSRYQSGQVDRSGGPLVHCCNRKLRAAILRGADSLLNSNDHFKDLATRWRQDGDDPRRIVVKVAHRLCRILYQMVAGGQVFNHPQYRDRHAILDKLIEFHCEHDSAGAVIAGDLKAAIDQLPRSAHAAEARPLLERLHVLRRGRARDHQQLRALLPEVLTRLGVDAVQCEESGVSSPR